MILLDDLRARKLVRAWQEAVALVQELADTVARASPPTVPDLEHTAVRLSGELVILPGSPPARHPGCQLAQALQALLDGTAAPAELRRLVSENACENPTCTSVEEFARALAVFERPNRRSDIASVVARDPRAESQVDLESELERLRTRAHQAADTRAKAEQERSARLRTRRLQRRVAIAASALVLCGAATVPAAYWLGNSHRGQGASPLRASIFRAGDRLARITQSGLKAVMSFRDTAASPETNESPDPAQALAPTAVTEGGLAQRPRTRPLDSRSETASQADVRRLDLLSTDDPHSPIELRAGEADSPPPEAGAGPLIYTHADKDVEPAVTLRQYLPSVTTDRVTDTPGELDIVVSETGEVESVRLVSPANRFRERMLVAAAKAWRFRPALKGGRPVKYRVRVRVTM